MDLLDQLARLQVLVVTGKGGVGKTAVSAVPRARLKKPLALISGDLAASLLAERLELGDGFEVLGTAGVSFGLDQAIQAQAVALDTKDGQLPTVGEQSVVGAPARDLSQDVQWAGAGDESEIEPSLDGLRVPPEGQFPAARHGGTGRMASGQ